VEDATNDTYGGSRPGNDLFADSLVCVDIHTGKMKWYYQLVHHPIFNYDISSPPLLGDIVVDGKPVKAVAVPTKEAFLYVFDRVTGKPIWPMIERPVPQSDTPGEKSSKTQPFPTKPAPYARQYLRMEDLIDFTPELHAKALDVIKQYRIGPMFNPAVVSKLGGPIKTLSMNNASGGTNWPGGGYDPESQTVFVPALNAGIVTRGLVEPPPGYSDAKYLEGEAGQPFTVAGGPGFGSASDAPKISADNARLAAVIARTGQTAAAGPAARATVDGLPLLKPPYGTLTAINLNSGDTLWQVAHGDTPDEIKNNPALKGLTIPKTGQSGNVGLVVTKSLVIMGDPLFSTPPGRPRGAMLHAYDKKTGAEVGAVWMPAPQSGSPMTYSYGGKQYIIVAVSGGNYSGDYIAYSLPEGR
jgi:quinoprotein glucose dehydrogenase